MVLNRLQPVFALVAMLSYCQLTVCNLQRCLSSYLPVDQAGLLAGACARTNLLSVYAWGHMSHLQTPLCTR